MFDFLKRKKEEDKKPKGKAVIIEDDKPDLFPTEDPTDI